MSNRELVVLGTASQAPTRTRNHNGYLLRWDGLGLLFDPGEGTQRQMTFAGVSANDVDHLCLTHFHGDHCLGVPGVLHRMTTDRVRGAVHAHYPASGATFFHHLRYASAYDDSVRLEEHPITRDGVIAHEAAGTLRAVRLEHRIDTFGYRLEEPDGHRMLPEELARTGVRGPDIGRLQREGSVVVGDRTVELAQVSRPRPGQRFAFVMDTRLCDGVFELADGADMLVIESTFLDQDATLAERYRHLTAAQAGRVAAACGVRCLVLTHFSQRYADPRRFQEEAAAAFDGQVVVAADLDRVPVPPRR
ncbi:ribonuclease Z [Saccharopolyspora rhizosphaerae]|uniref:Ribonuclease Z n=1 Tax=Saccharopolyspora rhizosphaerae TaxID=2492662 RepID=A0A426K4X7_9PSEU|nr:ribonuclease Z [Saccharopolyspora rhizosphaerae]RRO20453.1 ribonuclease Z [Saccharopolyspora rhizosphaerae]